MARDPLYLKLIATVNGRSLASEGSGGGAGEKTPPRAPEREIMIRNTAPLYFLSDEFYEKYVKEENEMAKATTHAHINFPSESCKNYVPDTDNWDYPANICPESLLVARPECPPAKVWPFKKGEVPTELCTLHGSDIQPPDDLTISKHPVHLEGKIVGFTAATLTELSMKDGRGWQESGWPGYLNVIAASGVNFIRSFVYGLDGTDDWDYWTPEKDGMSSYLRHLTWRIEEMAKRKLTACLSLTPYLGSINPTELHQIIRAVRDYRPYVMYEPINEPRVSDDQRWIVDILKGYGIPNESILLEHQDSSVWMQLWNDLPGRYGCLHWLGSMETVHAPNPDGWSTSPEWDKLLKAGMTGSSDGGDLMHAARGRYFYMADIASRTPAPDQAGEILKWLLSVGSPGYEFLSAAGQEETPYPVMSKAVLNGLSELRALGKAAWGA